MRDLYLLAESAAVESAVTRSAPGLARAYGDERAAALARRPPPDALTPPEREVEALVRCVLAAEPGAALPGLGGDPSPEASLAWARETAARLASGAAKYRGVPPVDAWGTVIAAAAAAAVETGCSSSRSTPIPKTNRRNARDRPRGTERPAGGRRRPRRSRAPIRPARRARIADPGAVR